MFLELKDFIAAVREYVADRGAFDETTRRPVLQTALEGAYNIIVRELRARGYTKTEIDTWAEGKIFQTKISLYLYFSDDTFARGENASVQLDAWKDFIDQLRTVALYDANGDAVGSDSGDLPDCSHSAADKIFDIDTAF